MTKTQVEVITSVQRRRSWSRSEKERIVTAARARRGRFGGGPGGWDPCQPVISLAPATLRAVPSSDGV